MGTHFAHKHPMIPGCPNKLCLKDKACIKHGHDFRKSDSKYVQRFRCKSCKKTYSNATFSLTYGQKKRRLNAPIYKHFNAGTSQRRIALILNCNLKTVARKLIFLAKICKAESEDYVQSLNVTEIQFDEMETFEHTKLKPLSIPLIVEKKTRKILALRVCEMPAKGLIAERSRRKYGRRRDDRTKAINSMFKNFKSPLLRLIESDQNPRYKPIVNVFYPGIEYKQYQGRRGCVTGQGELKEGARDPLFYLNHTCAMIRDSVKRLARRTWCTTKRKEMLEMHLHIYAHYHNFELT